MKIELSTVTKIRLTELDRLDPITVILEDIAPRQGKIIIECYGESWSSYWGGMGQKNIAEFFCCCDKHYLSKNLSSINSEITDEGVICDWLRSEIISSRRHFSYTKERARELWDDVEFYVENNANCLHTEQCNDLLLEIIGDDWWHDLPTKTNPEYEYLCRIIDAVQNGIGIFLKENNSSTNH